MPKALSRDLNLLENESPVCEHYALVVSVHFQH